MTTRITIQQAGTCITIEIDADGEVVLNTEPKPVAQEPEDPKNEPAFTEDDVAVLDDAERDEVYWIEEQLPRIGELPEGEAKEVMRLLEQYRATIRQRREDRGLPA